jgi:hypothetical protein
MTSIIYYFIYKFFIITCGIFFLIYKTNIVINLLFYNFIGIIFISINKIYIFKIKNTLKFNNFFTITANLY